MLKHQRELTLPRLNAAPTASHCRASMRLPRAGNQPVQARRPLPSDLRQKGSLSSLPSHFQFPSHAPKTVHDEKDDGAEGDGGD